MKVKLVLFALLGIAITCEESFEISPLSKSGEELSEAFGVHRLSA